PSRRSDKTGGGTEFLRGEFNCALKAASIEPTRQMVRLLETLICLQRRNASGIEMKTRFIKGRFFFILALPRGDFVSIYRRVSKYRHYRDTLRDSDLSLLR